MMMNGVTPSSSFSPVLFSSAQDDGKQLYAKLLEEHSASIVLDIFASQKKELFKIRHPQKALSSDELNEKYQVWLGNRNADEEGMWVYYSWLNKLVHILGKDEFIELRTNRNNYKITPAEQAFLTSKTIGIIGLSVGNAVALTMVAERICGKLKLADFDELELSNLNRIRAGIQNIGLNKCIVAAREIAEIDPYFEVECFTDGITSENIEHFLLGDNRLDILVDECDSIDIKIKARQEAKKHGIPVIMETSDRGMLDVERFDIETTRPLFHGLLEGLPAQMLENITPANRIPITLRIVNAPNGSARGKASMLEIGKTISTWPQLASSVTMGGGVVTDVSRRILLGSFTDSGRYYVDVEGIVHNQQVAASGVAVNPYTPFEFDRTIKTAVLPKAPSDSKILTKQQLEMIVEAACQAPSTGNDQPWKWLYKNGGLHLFHDRYRSFSFGNFHDVASYISFGAAWENLQLKAEEIGFGVTPIIAENQDNGLVASFFFYAQQNKAQRQYSDKLANFIFSRTTNRNPSKPSEITETQIKFLKAAAESVTDARLILITDKKAILTLGNIIGECDRVRLLNPEGHKDFVQREMRWSKKEAEETRDGIDIQTLGLPPALQVALSMIKDADVAQTLKNVENGGHALIDAAMLTASTSSAMAVIVLPEYNSANFFYGGVAMQRMWLQAEELGLAVHPLISPFYLFPRVTQAQGEGLSLADSDKLQRLRKLFLQTVDIGDAKAEVFLCKIAVADKPTVVSLRLPLSETFYFDGDDNNGAEW
jgi:molybdopterin/thiamine biosynthesis adenylyltransferase/nitroreductase